MSLPIPARPAARPPRIAAGAAMPLGVLALCASLLFGCGGHASVKAAAVSCFDASTPKVASVHAHDLVALRASVVRVLPQRVGRLYEEGTASAENAWTDADPAPPPVVASTLRPAGYEMRWIAPNGDDVAATVLSFASPAEARSFMTLATSTRCRIHGAQDFAAHPPLARNLAWVNPDGVAEADVYLARGRRVYRIGDVPADQQDGRAASAELGHSFITIDALACLLPGAHCQQTSRNVPA